MDEEIYGTTNKTVLFHLCVVTFNFLVIRCFNSRSKITPSFLIFKPKRKVKKGKNKNSIKNSRYANQVTVYIDISSNISNDGGNPSLFAHQFFDLVCLHP